MHFRFRTPAVFTALLTFTFSLMLPFVGTLAAAAPHRPLLIAHRGASALAPENTLPAFDQAVRMKADVIELDLRMSRDGRLVVIHDADVGRTTDGMGAVGKLTWRQLRSLDAGSWFDPSYKGTRIPSLDEVLSRYRGKIGILIEIKSPRLYEGIERKLAAELIRHKMNRAPYRGTVTVLSFDFRSVRRFGRIVPEIPSGILTNRGRDLRNARLRKFSFHSDFVSVGLGLVTKQTVQRIHAHGMKVLAWTVTDPLWVGPLQEMGVDGIIMDDPAFFDAFDSTRKQGFPAHGLVLRLAGT